MYDARVHIYKIYDLRAHKYFIIFCCFFPLCLCWSFVLKIHLIRGPQSRLSTSSSKWAKILHKWWAILGSLGSFPFSGSWRRLRIPTTDHFDQRWWNQMQIIKSVQVSAGLDEKMHAYRVCVCLPEKFAVIRDQALSVNSTIIFHYDQPEEYIVMAWRGLSSFGLYVLRCGWLQWRNISVCT